MILLRCVFIFLASFVLAGNLFADNNSSLFQRDAKDQEVVANLGGGLPKAGMGPSVTLKIKRSDTQIIINLDPTSTDVFLDILIKEQKTAPIILPSSHEPQQIPLPEPTKPSNGTKEQEPIIQSEATDDQGLQKKIQDMVEEALKKGEKKEEKKGEKKEGEEKPTANTDIVNHIYNAQKFYYAKNYKAALREVQKSLEIGKTAIGYALEGSILFALNDRDAAVRSWKSALAIDPNMTEVEAVLRMYEK